MSNYHNKMKKLEKTYVLNFSGKCNQRCLFCMIGDFKQNDTITSQTIYREIRLAKKLGFTKIDFFGGEPTSYSFFSNCIKYANKSGLRCTLATNALKFSSMKYVKKNFDQDLIEAVRVSLHSHLPDVHDKITGRKGSFVKTIKGIKNILSLMNSKRICVNIVINSLNYRHLPNIVKVVKNIGVLGVKFSGLTSTGMVLRNIGLLPDLSLVKKYLCKAVNLAKMLDMYFFVEKMPLCILKKRGIKLSSSYPEWHFIQEKNDAFVKLSKCVSCSVKNFCTGIDKKYLFLYGVPQFYPHVKFPKNSV